MQNLFNKIINNRQFNFQPLEFGNINGYTVDVKDEDGTRWEFRMLHINEAEYKLEGENIPTWIYEAEPELIKAISEFE